MGIKKSEPWKWTPIVHKVRMDAIARLDAGIETQWATIATYSTYYVEQRLQPRRDMEAIRRILHKRYPFETWTMRRQQVEDSWYGVHLQLRFLGWATEEERAAAKVRRAEHRRLALVEAQLEAQQEIADHAWHLAHRQIVPFWERPVG
jgi:hypothetical protein